MNHKEEAESSQIDISLCFSTSEMLCQEEIIFLDYIEEHNDISFETLRKNHVLNSKILNEVVDVPFINFHENTLQGSFEDQFDKVLEKL